MCTSGVNSLLQESVQAHVAWLRSSGSRWCQSSTCVRVHAHVSTDPLLQRRVCGLALQPCPDEACRLPSSCRACGPDRACNHGKLPSPELKLRLLPLLPQDLFTQPGTRNGKNLGRLC